ncbi:MAG: ABC transporter ATP-binding protein [Polyangiaceae bacterium]
MRRSRAERRHTVAQPDARTVPGLRRTWSAPYLVCAVPGLRRTWSAPYLVCAVSGLHRIWSAPYLVCAVSGLHRIWSAPYLVFTVPEDVRRNRWQSVRVSGTSAPSNRLLPKSSPLPKTSKQRFDSFQREAQGRARAALRRLLPTRVGDEAQAQEVSTQVPREVASGGDRTRSGTIFASLARRIARYRQWLAPGTTDLALVATLGILGIGIDMVWPLVSAWLVDHVILAKGMPQPVKIRCLLLGAALMAGVFLSNAALGYWRSIRHQLLVSKLQIGLRTKLFARMLRLPLPDLQNLRTGGLLSRLSGDVDQTATLVQQGFLSPILAVIRLLTTLTIIFSLDARIATTIFVGMPPVLVLQGFWARKMRGVWRSIGQDRQEIDGRVNEGLSGIRVVRGFRKEAREEAAHIVGLHTVARKQLLATRTQRILGTIWDLVLPLTQVAIVCYGGYLVVKGETTLGTMIAFQGYLFRLLEPVLALANTVADTQRGLAAMDRVFELLERPNEKPDPAEARDAPREIRSIRFRHVGFAYRPDVPVILDFDLEVPGGKTVALVGPSGAGKTTITDLLARFFDPTEGCIELNGIPLTDYRLTSYRGLLGIVSQEVFLFDGTIRENIAYAKPRATDAEIEHAARSANAHEFISVLPEGYDTVVGERGVRLSGGQRQRLSIARALLANPQILILDEATSNLDSESEVLIQRALQTLLSARTTFVIAHRLSTVKRADLICVLENGRLVELGGHAELMERGGRYARMVAHQHHDLRTDAPDFGPSRDVGSLLTLTSRRFFEGGTSSSPRLRPLGQASFQFELPRTYRLRLVHIGRGCYGAGPTKTRPERAVHPSLSWRPG